MTASRPAPRRVVAFVALVDLLAAALAVASVTLDGAGSRGVLGALGPAPASAPPPVVLLGLLLGGALVHIEAGRRVERSRKLDAMDRPHIDLKSMWSFAGLLVLPLGLALVLLLVTWVFWWWRVAEGLAGLRALFSAATGVLATVAAWAVLVVAAGHAVGGLSSPVGLLAVCLAGWVRWTVNHGLVCTVIRLDDASASWWARFSSPLEAMLGLGALGAGVALAVTLSATPWLVPTLIAPLLVVHRGFMLRGLTRAAYTDEKTGLVTAARWHARARIALARARRRGLRVGVLMVDLDEFKAVNDHYGHPVGDAVLRTVARALAEEVRERDAVGRYGGEEFVVLVTDADADGLEALAERLRRRVRSLAVTTTGLDGPVVVRSTTSVGTALFPDAAAGLDELVLAADAALYAAKAAGRDRVRAAPTAA